MSRKRKEVVTSIEDAASKIKDGMTVAIGGFGADNHPMTLIREIIRDGRKNLHGHRLGNGRARDRFADRRGLRKEVGRALCRTGDVLPHWPQLPQIRRIRADRDLGVQRIHPLCRIVRGGVGAGVLCLARRRRHQHSCSSIRIWSNSPTRSVRRRRSSPFRRCVPTGRLSMSAGRMHMATDSISGPVSVTVGSRVPPTGSCSRPSASCRIRSSARTPS